MKTIRRVGDEIVNVGTTPQGNRNATQVKAAANDHVPVNTLTMIESAIRESLFQISQDITIQAQDITEQPNREVAPRENQHASTMFSHLRDFTRKNPPMYFVSRVHEGPLEFLDEVYKILLSMGISTKE